METETWASSPADLFPNDPNYRFISTNVNSMGSESYQFGVMPEPFNYRRHTHGCWVTLTVFDRGTGATMVSNNYVVLASTVDRICEHLHSTWEKVAADTSGVEWRNASNTNKHPQLYRILLAEMTTALQNGVPLFTLDAIAADCKIAEFCVRRVTTTRQDTMLNVSRQRWKMLASQIAAAPSSSGAIALLPTVARSIWRLSLEVSLNPVFVQQFIRILICQPYGACTRLLSPARIRQAVSTMNSMYAELTSRRTVVQTANAANRSNGNVGIAPALGESSADPNRRMPRLGRGFEGLAKLISVGHADELDSRTLATELTDIATLLLRNVIVFSQDLDSTANMTTSRSATRAVPCDTDLESELDVLIQQQYTQSMLHALIKTTNTVKDPGDADAMDVDTGFGDGIHRPVIDEQTVKTFIPEIVAHVVDIVNGPTRFDFVSTGASSQAGVGGTGGSGQPKVFAALFSQPVCSVGQDAISKCPGFSESIMHLSINQTVRQILWKTFPFDPQSLLAQSLSGADSQAAWPRRSDFQMMPAFLATYSSELYAAEYLSALAALCAAPTISWSSFLVFRDWFWQVAHLLACHYKVSRAIMNCQTRRVLYLKPTMARSGDAPESHPDTGEFAGLLHAINSQSSLLPFEIYATLSANHTKPSPSSSSSSLLDRARMPDDGETETSGDPTHPDEETSEFQSRYSRRNKVPPEYTQSWAACRQRCHQAAWRLRLVRLDELSNAAATPPNATCGQPLGFAEALKQFVQTD